MKKLQYIIFPFCFFFLLHCNELKKTKSGVDKKNKAMVYYKNLKHDNYAFKVYYTPFDSIYSSIDSLYIEFKNIRQTINLTKNKMQLKTQLIDVFPIYTYNDYNFDGVNDISVMYDEAYVTHDILYYHLLYNKSKNIYDENNQLDSIYNIELSQSEKIICSKYSYKTSGSFVNDLSFYKKYKWIKDSLKPIGIIEERPVKINDKKPIDISENGKLENVKYLIIENDLIKKTKKVYTTKNSVIDKINCE